MTGTYRSTWQFVDNVSKFVGNHGLNFGIDIRYLLLNASTVNWPLGQINFTRDITGNSAAAYMLGFPYRILTREGYPDSANRGWRYFFYFQDDWKVTSKLTLDLSIRYDLLGLPHEFT